MSIIGISERLVITSSYETKINERKIHLHLYNTYTDKRNLTYERFYKTATERNLLVQRVYLYSDRKLITSGYSIFEDFRKLVKPNSFVKYTDERKLTYERWFSTYNERKITQNYVLHLTDERKLLTKGSYISQRKIFLKHWYGSERSLYTYGIKKQPIRDVRKIFIQIYSHLAVIRKVFTPITSFKFTLTINPLKNNLNNKIFKVGGIGEIKVNPFQGSTHNGHLKVIDEEIYFNIFFIKDNLIKGNLNLIYYNSEFNNWFVDDITISTQRYYPLIKISENTYLFRCYLVPTKDNLVLRITPPLLTLRQNKEIQKPVLDWLNYEMNRHSILNVKINKKEYDFPKLLILENVNKEIIELEFYITGLFFDKFYTQFKDNPNVVQDIDDKNIVMFLLQYTFIDNLENDLSQLSLSPFILTLYRKE